MTEFTLVLGEWEAEVYVDLDETTGKVLDVYADAGVLDSVGAVELPSANSHFHHAAEPERALEALLAADAVCGGEEAAEFYRLIGQESPWGEPAFGAEDE